MTNTIDPDNLLQYRKRLNVAGEFLCGLTDDLKAREAYAAVLYVQSSLLLDAKEMKLATGEGAAMTAAEIAYKLAKTGGDTASLFPAEQFLLMRALRTWDDLLAALQQIAAYSPASTVQPVSIARDAIARAEGGAP